LVESGDSWKPELIHRNSSDFEGSYSRGTYFVIACKKVLMVYVVNET
jgi:hypothetical protein